MRGSGYFAAGNKPNQSPVIANAIISAIFRKALSLSP